LEALVREIIGRVADKWTMLALEVLSEHGRLRFTRLGELIGGVSQKMLTKTLRQMEDIAWTLVPRGPKRHAGFVAPADWKEGDREIELVLDDEA